MLKNLKNNKKGFTLIELLAVIVILAILVMVAIPAITKYLDTSRKGAMADSVNTAIDAVRNDYMTSEVAAGTEAEYDLNKINTLLSKQMKTSPFGGNYTGWITIQEIIGASNKTAYSINGCIQAGDANHQIKIEMNDTTSQVVKRDNIEANVCNSTK